MAKFPDSTTSTCTIRGHQYVNAYTNTIRNLGLTDFPMDYFLGWIRPESLTELLKETFIALETNDGSTEVVAIPPEYNANIPVGYWFDTSSDLNATTSFLLHERTGNDPYSFTVTGGNSSRLINKFYPENFGMFRYCQFTFKYTLYSPPPDSSIVKVLGNVNFNVSNVVDAMNFLNGLAPYTFTINYSGTSLKFTVNGSDFSTGTAIYTDDDNLGYQARFFFSSIGIDGMNAGENGVSNANTCIAPMIKQTMAFHSTDSSQDYTRTVMYGNLQAGASTQIAIVKYDSVGITELSYYDYANVRSRCGGISGKVSFSEEAVIDSNEKLLYNGGVILAKTDNNWQKYVYLYHPIDEAIKFINLFSKINKVAYQSYVNGITYAVSVDSNNEFLDEIKTGDILDDTFRAGLLDWQYVPLNDDGTDQGTGKSEFDPTNPEDMPPYTPPGPEPTPGTDIPDDENPEPLNPGEKGDEGNVEKNTVTPNGVSAFTTSYIMTELEVSSFGNRLWTTVQTEPSAQRNFFTIKDDTANYELTNANIIDYLVSLKWYPFSITSYCNFSTWSAYLIGSGTYAYTGAAYVAEDAVGYIPGGSVTIPWSTNTFVDLEPYTSVSFYIPFCGTIDIPASKVRGRRVTLDYYVDYITGGCTAYLTVPTANGSFPVASINGTLGFDMLVTGNNAQVIAARAYQQNNERRLREIEGLGGAIVDAVGGLVSSAQSGGGSKSGSSRDFGSVGGITSLVKSVGSAAFSEVQGKLSQGTLQGTSPLTLGGSSTLSSIGYLKPFAAVTSRVFFNNGTGYDKVGYISNKPLTISNIKDGVFFNCINPELKNIGATNSELAQITSMLSSGVYK